MKKIIIILFCVLFFGCNIQRQTTDIYLMQIIDHSWLKIDHSITRFPEYKIKKKIKRLGLPEGCDTTVFYNCVTRWTIIFEDVTTYKDICKQVTYIPITYPDVNKEDYLFGIKWDIFKRTILTNKDRNNIVYYID
jgi:hypothetical protein